MSHETPRQDSKTPSPKKAFKDLNLPPVDPALRERLHNMTGKEIGQELADAMNNTPGWETRSKY